MRLKKRYLLLGLGTVALAFVVLRESESNRDIYQSQLGEPLAGLSMRQKEIFQRGKELFEHDFTVEEGLGPLFNGQSCFECHGKPTMAGLEGRDITTTGIVRIGAVSAQSPLFHHLKEAKVEVDSSSFSGLIEKGGPAIQRRSITQEFPKKYPPDCNVEVGVVPPEAQFISLRHAGPLLGFGLIDAIDERAIMANMFKQAKDAPDLVGRTNTSVDPLTLRTKIGRFGWKDQNPDLLLFTAEALNTEMGVTTYIQNSMRSSTGISEFPKCIMHYLPREPNDTGRKLILLSDFQALLAPPAARVLSQEQKQGKDLFEKLRCAVCHTPELSTQAVVKIPDPDSPLPRLNYIEIKALEDRPVKLYSDLLLHNMGEKLADGIVQNTARGGEWRTTPLWGIKYKKFYLHNGRAKTIEDAILAHGGQAEAVTHEFTRLPEKDKKALLDFVSSL